MKFNVKNYGLKPFYTEYNYNLSKVNYMLLHISIKDSQTSVLNAKYFFVE